MIGDLVLAAALNGPFPPMCTPYTEKGEVDYATLAKEAAFVADCGANGAIWPAADDALKLLTPEEERRGWTAIAGTLKGRDVWFCPCCPGTNVTDQLRRLKDAELAWRGVFGAGRSGSAPYRVDATESTDERYLGRRRSPSAPYRVGRMVGLGRGRSPSAPMVKAWMEYANGK